jgi:hypothetical protein
VLPIRGLGCSELVLIFSNGRKVVGGGYILVRKRRVKGRRGDVDWVMMLRVRSAEERQIGRRAAANMLNEFEKVR